MANTYSEVAINNQVELNFTPPQNFFLTAERLPKLVFTIQDFTIPTLVAGESILPNSLNPGRVYIPGDGLDYGTLEINYVIDKEFKTYREIIRWIKGITAPETGDQATNYQNSIPRRQPAHAKFFSNIELFGTDAGNKALISWKFKDAFPIGVGGPTYDSKTLDVEPLVGSVSFRYMYFECETYTNGQANNDKI